MIFAKLDVSIYAHRRFVEAGFEAVGYWALALAYLRHQESEDGFLCLSLIGVPLGAGPERCRPLCERLASVGLFREAEGGYFLVNYAEKNETKDEIEVRKKAVRARKASSRKSRSQSRVGQVVTPPVTRDIHGMSRVTSDSDSDSFSHSGSGSDSGGPDPYPARDPEERRPLPRSERGLSGPLWLAAFTEGIAKVTGRPCTAGRVYLGTLERIVTHHAPARDPASACTWLRDEAAAFAKKWDGKHPAKGLTPDGLERWLNEGRQGPPQFGRERIVQLPAEEWHEDDFSDLGAEVPK